MPSRTTAWRAMVLALATFVAVVVLAWNGWSGAQNDPPASSTPSEPPTTEAPPTTGTPPSSEPRTATTAGRPAEQAQPTTTAAETTTSNSLLIPGPPEGVGTAGDSPAPGESTITTETAAQTTDADNTGTVVVLVITGLLVVALLLSLLTWAYWRRTRPDKAVADAAEQPAPSRGREQRAPEHARARTRARPPVSPAEVESSNGPRAPAAPETPAAAPAPASQASRRSGPRHAARKRR